MQTPTLTRAQESLRGRKLTDMSEAELRLWIDACNRMESWPGMPAKARRSWKGSRAKAEALLASKQFGNPVTEHGDETK